VGLVVSWSAGAVSFVMTMVFHHAPFMTVIVFRIAAVSLSMVTILPTVI